MNKCSSYIFVIDYTSIGKIRECNCHTFEDMESSESQLIETFANSWLDCLVHDGVSHFHYSSSQKL